MKPLERVGAATLDVLTVLLDGEHPRWGLEIIKLTGRPSGSVYPLLDRLERSGWVTSSWDDDADRRGPRRRMYVLTPEGAREAVKVLARKTSKTNRPLPAPGPEAAR